MNQGLPIDDREGFAAFLLRLRGRGTVPKALIAAFEAIYFHGRKWIDLPPGSFAHAGTNVNTVLLAIRKPG